MNEVNLVSKSGQDYTIKYPNGYDGVDGGYVFAYAKSGSTLLDRLVRDYSKKVGVPTFSLFGSAFTEGVKPIDIMSDAKCTLESPSVIYTGFRHYPMNFDIDLSGSKSILLVRDPRDMLVSLYYSIAKSHVKLKGSTSFEEERIAALESSIDSFVIKRADSYVNHFKRYQEKLSTHDVVIYRYEDVIYEKVKWLTDIVKYFNLPLSNEAIEEVVKKHDIIPLEEEENSHVRQVHPGNYENKLKDSTIITLNNILIDFLGEHSYI